MSSPSQVSRLWALRYLPRPRNRFGHFARAELVQRWDGKHRWLRYWIGTAPQYAGWPGPS